MGRQTTALPKRQHFRRPRMVFRQLPLPTLGRRTLPLDGELWKFEAVSGAVRRKNPPPLGAIITYRHQGLAGDGNPRFPVFPRVRDDEPRDD